MARIRSVHPGLWTDEAFVSVSPIARLTLIHLWARSSGPGLVVPKSSDDASALLAAGLVRWADSNVLLCRHLGRPGLPWADASLVAKFVSFWSANRIAKSWASRGTGISFSAWRNLRAAVFIRDDFTCTYCGSVGPLECDHIIPLARGGPSVMENLTTACRPCNRQKGAK